MVAQTSNRLELVDAIVLIAATASGSALGRAVGTSQATSPETIANYVVSVAWLWTYALLALNLTPRRDRQDGVNRDPENQMLHRCGVRYGGSGGASQCKALTERAHRTRNLSRQDSRHALTTPEAEIDGLPRGGGLLWTVAWWASSAESPGGVVAGVMGGIVGTYFSIKNAKGPKERAFAIRAAALCWLGVSAFLGLPLPAGACTGGGRCSGYVSLCHCCSGSSDGRMRDRPMPGSRT